MPRDDKPFTTPAAADALDAMELQLAYLQGTAQIIDSLQGSPSQLEDLALATLSHFVDQLHDRLHGLWRVAIGRPEAQAPAAPAGVSNTANQDRR